MEEGTTKQDLGVLPLLNVSLHCCLVSWLDAGILCHGSQVTDVGTNLSIILFSAATSCTTKRVPHAHREPVPPLLGISVGSKHAFSSLTMPSSLRHFLGDFSYI